MYRILKFAFVALFALQVLSAFARPFSFLGGPILGPINPSAEQLPDIPLEGMKEGDQVVLYWNKVFTGYTQVFSNYKGTYPQYYIFESSDGVNWDEVYQEIDRSDCFGGYCPKHVTLSNRQGSRYEYRLVQCLVSEGWGNIQRECSSGEIPLIVGSNAISPPSNITVPRVSHDGVIKVSWPFNVGANGYEIEEKYNQGSWKSLDPSKIDGDVAKRIVFYIRTGLVPGQYVYRVKACNDNTCSDWANSSVVTVDDNPEANERPNFVSNPLAGTDYGEVVGSIEGELKVTPMGSATYSMAIEQAPGTAGLTPNLGLSYDSSQGNGWLGVGWSINGISVISRCAQTKEQDGKSAAISFSSSDRFCLDGKKLLVQGDARHYGRYGTRYLFENKEPMHIEITATDSYGPSEFTIKSIDGSKLIYKALYTNRIDGDASRPAIAWPLAKKIDVSGNEITYEYEFSSNATLSYRLKRVSYAQGLNKIEFDYEDRPDKVMGYSGGYQFNVNKRLKSVTSYSGYAELRKYELEYIKAVVSGRSLVRSIQASRGSSYLPKTVFDWQQGNQEFSSIIKLDRGTAYHDTRIQRVLPYLLLDMNGDGKLDYWKVRNRSNDSTDDVLFITGGDKFEEIQYHSNLASLEFRTSAKVMDVDNDGRDDVLFSKNGQWHIYRSILNPSNPNDVLYQLDSPINLGISSLNHSVKIADFNSDGFPDISYLYNKEIYISYNIKKGNYRGFLEPVRFVVPELESFFNSMSNDRFSSLTHAGAYFRNATTLTEYYDNFFKIIDMDGDGKNELLIGIPTKKIVVHGFQDSDNVSTEGKWTVYSIGDSLEKLYELGTLNLVNYSYLEVAGIEHGAWHSEHNVRQYMGIMDFNGDGLKDAYYFKRSDAGDPGGRGIHKNLYVSLNLGNGAFGKEIDFGRVSLQGIEANVVDYLLNDYNSDGYIDLVLYENWNQNEKLSVRYFNGEKVASSVQTEIQYDPGIINKLVDVNGDGNLDYLMLRGRLHQWLSTSPIRDVMTKVTDGFEHATQINYGTITEAKAADYYVKETDGHTKVWGNGGLVVDVNQPYKVVTSVQSQDSYLVYQYKGLKAQFGRGMLGFSQVSNYERLTSTKRIATYRQDFPYSGKVVKEQTSYIDNLSIVSPGSITCSPSTTCREFYAGLYTTRVKPLEITNRTYKRYKGNGYLYPERVDEHKFDVNSGRQLSLTTTLRQQPDDWGHFGRVTKTISGDGWHKVVQDKVYDDYGSYLGGRLKHQTQTYSRSDVGSSVVVKKHFGYDTLGRLEYEEIDGSEGSGNAVNDPSGANYYSKQSYTRNQFGNVTLTKVEGDGFVTRVTENRYDSYGRYVTKEIKHRGFPSDDFTLETTTQYHSVFGTPQKITSANGQVSRLGYSQLGRLNYKWAPDGSYSTIDQKRCTGNCVAGAWYYQKTTQSHGEDTIEYFDNRHRKLAEKTLVVRAYNGSTTSKAWRWTRFRYDALGRITATSIPHFSDMGLSQLSQGTSISDLPQGYLGVGYDAIGRKVQTTDAKGNLWTIGYNDKTETSTDPDGRTSTKVVNMAGELLASIDVDGNRLSYTYSADGKLEKVIRQGQEGQVVTQNFYDHLGRKVKMIDPDKGTLEYRYDGLGNLIWQRDNKGQVTTQAFDGLNRMLWRKRAYSNGRLDQHTSWHYDTKQYGKGLVASIEDHTNQLTQEFDYHWLSKPKRKTIKLGSGASQQTFVERTLFLGPEDAFAPKVEIDATGYGIGYTYASNVVVKKHNLRDNKLLWQFGEQTAFGKAKSYRLGNGLTTTQGYDELSGNLISIQTGRYASVQNLSYRFDRYGDLEFREDLLNNVREDFTYDNLHRLTDVTLVNSSGRHQYSVSYDALGNIRSKTGVGTYHYDLSRPHAVSRITGGDLAGSFSYDANGNMTQGGGRSRVDYNTLDKPTYIAAASNSTAFSYGFDGVRFKRVDNYNGSRKQTLYIGNVEFVSKNGITSLVQRHLAGVAVEMEYFGNNSRRELNFLYRDHLGSVTVMTNASGAIINESSFDVWGQRRPMDTGMAHPLKQLNKAAISAHADYNRGYTGHEHIDELGIIHMNGRVYDPRLARFLSVDPIVADGTNLQTYNRYSYVRNNPLNATDPSGYNPLFIVNVIVSALVADGVITGVLAVAYYIYTAYSIVDSLYNVVQAFKYGGGDAGLIISAAQSIYSAYGMVAGLAKASTSSNVTEGVEGSSKRTNKVVDYSEPDFSKFDLSKTDAKIAEALYGDLHGNDFGVTAGINWAEMPVPPQYVMDGVVGFGDGAFNAITFGLGDLDEIRKAMGIDGGVNLNSDAYNNSYIVGAINGGGAVGGALGLVGKGVKGFEYSHFIPQRYLKNYGITRSWRPAINGTYVPKLYHALTDKFRYRFLPRTFKIQYGLQSPIPQGVQQLLRTPPVIVGSGLGATSDR